MRWSELDVVAAVPLIDGQGVAVRNPVVRDRRQGHRFLVSDVNAEDVLPGSPLSDEDLAVGAWLAIPPQQAIQGHLLLLCGISVEKLMRQTGSPPLPGTGVLSRDTRVVYVNAQALTEWRGQTSLAMLEETARLLQSLLEERSVLRSEDPIVEALLNATRHIAVRGTNARRRLYYLTAVYFLMRDDQRRYRSLLEIGNHETSSGTFGSRVETVARHLLGRWTPKRRSVFGLADARRSYRGFALSTA